LTRDAAAIEESGRVLPIGFWKGSGFSLVLDMIAAGLSGGQATHEIPAEPELETGISQVFIAINSGTNDIGDKIVADLKSIDGVRYPGERTLAIRTANLQQGVPINPEVWATVCKLANGEHPKTA
jgi:3-dehydro-L-gulonate 2-dehydrogenase